MSSSSNNSNSNDRDEEEDRNSSSRFSTGRLQQRSSPPMTDPSSTIPTTSTAVAPRGPPSIMFDLISDASSRSRTSFRPRHDTFRDEDDDDHNVAAASRNRNAMLSNMTTTRQEQIDQLLAMSVMNSDLPRYDREEEQQLELSAREWALQDMSFQNHGNDDGGDDDDLVDLDELGYDGHVNTDVVELQGFYSKALPSLASSSASAQASSSYWKEEQERQDRHSQPQGSSIIPHQDSSYYDDDDDRRPTRRAKPKAAYNATTTGSSTRGSRRLRVMPPVPDLPTRDEVRRGLRSAHDQVQSAQEHVRSKVENLKLPASRDELRQSLQSAHRRVRAAKDQRCGAHGNRQFLLLLRWCCIVVGVALVVAAVAALVVLPSSQLGDHSQDHVKERTNDNNYATFAPYKPANPGEPLHDLDPLSLVLAHVPNYTLHALHQQQSPQHMATQWITKDPNLHEYFEQDVDSDAPTDSFWRFEQRFALATLYYSLNGPHWRCFNDVCSDHKWLNYSVPECHWMQGVCNDMGQYTYLPIHYVSGMQGGSLPPEIGLLSNLAVLQLSNTDLEVNLQDLLPMELRNLRHLKKIDYSHSRLTGQIPLTPLIYLHELEELAVNDNDLSGLPPTNLFRLRNFQRLKVTDNPKMQQAQQQQLEQLHQSDPPGSSTTSSSTTIEASSVAGSSQQVPAKTMPLPHATNFTAFNASVEP